MSVRIENRDIFESKEQAIVITVNCVGIMGKGVAAGFKERWPHLFNLYVKRCRTGKMVPGCITRNDVFRLPDGRYAILMPTKSHWKYPRELQWISSGLKDLRKIVDMFCLDSVALPPPGCGNGQLDFTDVLPLINKNFADNPDIDLVVCV